MDEKQVIEKYISYLIDECGLSVTLHPVANESLISFSDLLKFNIHNNSYCTHVKSCNGGYQRCIEHQKKVYSKICTLGTAFCGICYAGVFEYVYPLFDGNETIGFISVGSYRDGNGDSRVASVSESYGYFSDAMEKAYLTLESDIPDKERIDTLLYPLCKMFELAYMNDPRKTPEDELITDIKRYIAMNYSGNITTSDICRKFYCSRSHFSHTFKKETGKTFREYLNCIRVDHAKYLLDHTPLSITEIAYSVGFNDANYFSSVFKAEIGTSPIAYRREKNKALY